MDRDYFEKRVSCFEALLTRLSEIQANIPDRTLLEAVREKVAHSRKQAELRGKGRLSRPFLALLDLLTGKYHRFGRGVKSYLVDAFLG